MNLAVLGPVFDGVASTARSACLAAALWSWSASSTMWIALHQRRHGVVTVRRGAAIIGLTVAITLVAAQSLVMAVRGQADLFGIKRLTIDPPSLWWVWIGLLLLEPAATAARFVANRGLLARRAAREGRPVEVAPTWDKVAKKLEEQMGRAGGNFG